MTRISLEVPTIEQGWKSDIQIFDGEITKTSRHVFPTIDEASTTLAGLESYARELAPQTIQVADLHGTEVLSDDSGGYRVRHTYGLVNGPSLVRLDGDERQHAVRETLLQIAEMDTVDNPDKLKTPIDARAENFHLNENGNPILTDIYPALTRLPDGSFPLEAVGEQRLGRLSALSWIMGTKSAVMSRVLLTTADQGGNVGGFRRHIDTDLDWCYDTLPSGMKAVVRDRVRHQIDKSFVPFLGRNALSRHAKKILR